ncbi:hypothetical protein MXB_4476 [Myxobolus squamalis]|nr:hypothetical protein MXB_4476 [Myxobolus squamalis]
MASETTSGIPSIKVTKNAKNQCKGRKERWPKDAQKYTKFSLFKVNMTTTDAIKLLSKKLHVKFGAFSFCGNKDKRGATVQHACVSKMDPSKLHKLFYSNKSDTYKGSCVLMIGNICLSSNPLKLGELLGNQFEITIRDILPLNTNDECSINTDLKNIFENLSNYGFPNFFGKQRFGVGDISTYIIGQHILLSDWEAAANGILSERPRMNEALKLAIREWKNTKDATKAADLIDYKNRNALESCLLIKISVNDNKIDSDSFSCIPYTIQTMYLHAFQSYIWNCILSLRLQV